MNMAQGVASRHERRRAVTTMVARRDACYLVALAVLLACLLVACGGGSDGSSVDTPVVTQPAITTQPASQTVAPGANATFSVAATGNGLAYQWQRSTTGGVGWQDISGATQSSYTVTAVDASMNGYQYHVIVGNVVGMIVSNPATLTVSAAGGGTGGGGGTGTIPAECVPANVLPVGMVVKADYAIDIGGTAGTPQQAILTVVGPSTFQGRSVFETSLDTTGTFFPGTTRTFSTYDPASRMLTPYGAIVNIDVGGAQVAVTSVVRQPAQYPVYTLAAGQTATVTTVADNTQITTTNGTPSAPSTTTETTTTTHTFAGTETLTVPAGTFLTCKLIQNVAGSSGASTTWLMAGYGATVKSIAGVTTQTLGAITVNGVALTRFP